jgi:hypothetical protein
MPVDRRFQSDEIGSAEFLTIELMPFRIDFLLMQDTGCLCFDPYIEPGAFGLTLTFQLNLTISRGRVPAHSIRT